MNFFISSLFTLSLIFSQNNELLKTNLIKQLNSIVDNSEGQIGLYAIDLLSNDIIAINENTVFPQGSAIKVPILIELIKQSEEKKINLNTLIELDFKKKVNGGILAELTNPNLKMTLNDLAIAMIVLSDNWATNIIIEKIGIENVNLTINNMGLKETKLQRIMLDSKASANNKENVSTPFEAAQIMLKLYKGEIISKKKSDEIIELLKKFKEGSINSQIPESIEIAFKAGQIPGVNTEWAIVFLAQRPYILTLMNSYGKNSTRNESFERISACLYAYFNKLGNSNDFGTYSRELH
jgi:beta-lactamase class A